MNHRTVAILLALSLSLGGCALIKAAQDPPEEDESGLDGFLPDMNPPPNPEPEPCVGALNACGGCDTLEGVPGGACGECDAGTLACDGTDALVCDAPDEVVRNACGGCGPIDDTQLGELCDNCGRFQCVGEDSIECVMGQGDDNACGGCAPLDAIPGESCGPCGLDRIVCGGPEEVVCDGTTGCPQGFAFVPAGTFTMGSALAEPGRYEDELAHEVTFTHDIMAAQTEITQNQFDDLMGGNPSFNSGCNACPVESVTWYDAIAFANALSLSEDLAPCYQAPNGGIYELNDAFEQRTPGWPAGLECEGYRLPTEAEWEYIARAGSETAFTNGDITFAGDVCGEDPVLDQIGWYCANTITTQPAARKVANAFGFFDMHGNVDEWVWDWSGAYSPNPQTDPTGPEEGASRMVRGGSFVFEPRACRSAFRNVGTPDARDPNLGFRVVRTVR